MDAPVRLRRDTDVAACTRLLHVVHVSDRHQDRWPEDPASWLRPSGMLAAWVAERGGRVVGHVTLRVSLPGHGVAIWSQAAGLPQERLACVSRLFTAPDVRGAGLGGSLLEAACARARAEGRHPVLDVMDDSLAAIALYERRGWRQAGSVAWKGDYVAPPADPRE
ncbi:MAG: GNAT family N-acetyltransferase [Deinococcales bacterium]